MGDKLKTKTIIFILIIMGGLVLLSGCSSKSNEATNVKPANSTELFSGNILSLFPSRDEINTEYKTENTDFKIEDFFPKYQSQGLKTTGFEVGKEIDLYIVEGTKETDGYIFILKFGTQQNAAEFENNLISMTKNEGGYIERNPASVNANCFAIEGGNTIEAFHVDYYCQKKNLFFSTEIVTWKKSRFSDAEIWAQKIANKLE